MDNNFKKEQEAHERTRKQLKVAEEDQKQLGEVLKKNAELAQKNKELRKDLNDWIEAGESWDTKINNINKEWEMKVSTLSKTNDLRLSEIRRLQNERDHLKEKLSCPELRSEEEDLNLMRRQLSFIQEDREKLSDILQDILRTKENEIKKLKSENASIREANALFAEEAKKKMQDEIDHKKAKEEQSPKNLASTAQSINNLESRIIEIDDSGKERFAKIEAEFAFHEADFEDWINIFKDYQDRTEKLESELEYIGSLFSQVGKCLKETKQE